MDILKPHEWSPAWTIESICRAIVNLLSNPNADSPLNCDPGNQIRAGDKLGFESMALMYCVEFAQDESLVAAKDMLEAKLGVLNE